MHQRNEIHDEFGFELQKNADRLIRFAIRPTI